ncbi:hypothetical protein GALMADRAFT_775349 [Galerina marginata CBS 339.88]|uniref:Uncharacterized protein n=1 Tax=Galerina marginata (strain CBS 339.88) TaxID=685588 RepID=A0A067SWS8_GALM3|nr:hypothetical protein GALMADRAFT_775349 [Galerina marginata CBS 339.88]
MDSATVEKKVRFSNQVQVHVDDYDPGESPVSTGSPQATPSLTPSMLTNSSDGPLTPQTANVSVVVESKGSAPFNLTGVPIVHPNIKTGAVLGWDMAKDPDSDAIISQLKGLQDPAALLHGVGLKRLILTNDDTSFRLLNIGSDTGPIVTVKMVLSDLHKHLQVEGITESGHFYRLIDYLQDGQQFQGLSVKGVNGAGVWEFTFHVD